MVLFLDLRLSQMRNATVKISGNGMQETISYMEGVWKTLATRTPFDFYFVDEWFQDQYRKEQVLLKTASIYSGISILLCALGLFGITSLSMQQRMKEIGIRRVLGASATSLVKIASGQFMIIILAGLLFAGPLAFFLIGQWLKQFPYQTSISSWPFITTAGIIITFSITVISILAKRAANTDIVKVLKKE